MRLDLNRKPEAVWVSFDEFCGRGDGKTREFKTPIPPAEAREVLVMSDFQVLAPDGRYIMRNDKDGTILKDEPDGYKLEVRPGDELWIVFDRPRAFDARVNVSGLGREVGDAFKILPMTDTLQRTLGEAMPENIRRPKKREDATDADQMEAGRINFMGLVMDWRGIVSSDGTPVPCDEASKKAFLNTKNAQFFGLFCRQRALALQEEAIHSHEADSRD
jgi:hypothetical protein